ncbi:MAG: phosphatidate cytidylyltransferase [Lentisphaeria bacterium]|nr:phosphatidate cytidylyltransferase [Lentisphaeria bacterium]
MFIKRLFSTIILLGLFGAAIFAPSPWNKIVFLLLSMLLTFGLVREICKIVKHLGMETFENITTWFCTLVILFINVSFFELLPAYSYSKRTISNVLFYMLLFGIALGGPLFILFSKNSGEKIKKVFNSMGIAVFTLLPILFILGIYFIGCFRCSDRWTFNYYFLIFVLLTKIGDIGAYVVGTVSNKLMKGGNHKMIPSISPGKSWEGAAGGLIITILLAISFHYLFPQAIMVGSIPIAIITGTLMFFGSMAGDLMESVLKRAAGVKDSGSIIPGIGGVFDLVDSLFVTAPVAAIILLSINFISVN